MEELQVNEPNNYTKMYTYRKEVFDGIPLGTFPIPIHVTSNLILPKRVQLQTFGSEQLVVSHNVMYTSHRPKMSRHILAHIASDLLPMVISGNKIENCPNANESLSSRVESF